MSDTLAPLEVFCSYAHKDKPLLQQLEIHLSVLKDQGLISTWDDQQVAPGTDRVQTINIHLNSASVILFLISPAFLASKYHSGIEMEQALRRHQTNEARVIPILLRPVDWQGTPFEKLKALPSNGKPITAWRSRDEAFANVVVGIRQAIEDLAYPSKATPSGKPPRIWNVPYARNRFFTGREELLSLLHEKLTTKGNSDTTSASIAALTQPQAIKGLGGIGKTQIAVEYAHRHRDSYPLTLWINAATEETLISSFISVADLLPSFVAKHGADQEKIVETVKRWLEQSENRWLLIFDNADDIELVRRFLPKGGQGSIVLTTRAHAVGAIASSIEVEKMGLMEGVHLLLRRANCSEHASDEGVNEAGNIVIALDYLPLALDQAGAYIEETEVRSVHAKPWQHGDAWQGE